MTVARIAPYEEHLRAAADEVIRLRTEAAKRADCAWERYTRTRPTRCASPFVLPLSLTFVMGLAAGLVIWWLW